jgi:hypothetical protein
LIGEQPLRWNSIRHFKDFSDIGFSENFRLQALVPSRVEEERGGLGHSASLRFLSPLIEPDVPISGIRLSDWLHRKAHG